MLLTFIPNEKVGIFISKMAISVSVKRFRVCHDEGIGSQTMSDWVSCNSCFLIIYVPVELF